ncbi:MAG: geranylgeranyl reductase family protein [Actinomycetota bacterium]
MTDTANTRRDVDVLVVGAGPGGSATAYHLARHGIDVMLVERSAFPREKACGDGLTPRGVKAVIRMGVDPDDPGFERVRGLQVHTRKVTLHFPWPTLHDYPDYGLIRTRMELDDLLVRRAEKAGATLHERIEAVSPVLVDGWVAGATVRPVDGGEPAEVRTRFIVAADGASSRFAAQAGVGRDASRPLGIAARRYYRTNRRPGPWMDVWMDLWDEDSLMPGFGWIFPLADGRVNVGAGLLNTFRNFKNVSAQRVFDAFCSTLPRDWGVGEETSDGRLLSGPLPMALNRGPQAVPGMLVVGDAAGLVNPFNGEGIAYAIESGEIAAELIHDALVKDRPGLAHMYPAVLRERYGRYFRVGREFVRLIGNPKVMRVLTEYGLPRQWLMRFAHRFMSNLTDGRKGDAQDRLMDALLRLVPA